jgi:hypothetical protein
VGCHVCKQQQGKSWIAIFMCTAVLPLSLLLIEALVCCMAFSDLPGAWRVAGRSTMTQVSTFGAVVGLG